MMGAYIACCLSTLFLPVPKLGITQEVVERQEFKATGVWMDHPHKVIAFGTLYFSALGLYELF